MLYAFKHCYPIWQPQVRTFLPSCLKTQAGGFSCCSPFGRVDHEQSWAGGPETLARGHWHGGSHRLPQQCFQQHLHTALTFSTHTGRQVPSSWAVRESSSPVWTHTHNFTGALPVSQTLLLIPRVSNSLTPPAWYLLAKGHRHSHILDCRNSWENSYWEYRTDCIYQVQPAPYATSPFYIYFVSPLSLSPAHFLISCIVPLTAHPLAPSILNPPFSIFLREKYYYFIWHGCMTCETWRNCTFQIPKKKT